MKKNVRTISLSILAASLLVACGGGGGGGAPANNGGAGAGAGAGAGGGAGGGVVVTPPVSAQPTTATAAALVAIQTQLTAFQTQFATTMPLASNATLNGLLDATFMDSGDNKAAFLASVTGPQGFVIGDTFGAPIGVASLDTGAAPNDATHQWFATSLAKGNGRQYFTMLAIKNAAGQWLIAGNQRQAAVTVTLFADQLITPVGAGTTTTFSSGVNLWVGVNNPGPTGSDAALLAKGVTSATVTGPGVIGATAGALGAATIFTATAPVGGMAGSQWIPNCGTGVGGVTTNCVDMLKVAPGTYSFNIVGTSPGVGGAAFNYTYNEKVIGALPATLTATNFPVIAPGTTPAAGYTSGATVTVNWTVPAGQIAQGVNWFGTLSTGMPVNMWVNAVGNAGQTINSSTVLPAFAPATLVSGQFSVTSMDANGVAYSTTR
ncbi:MAG: hypothetical protein PXX73_00875 [Sideroxydans sp.]|nr:hypothetical protein [Sideroxydans sp.]